ncbi:hypothetical protein SELMODRAFT_403193 [Selaginella moellendorffii]|uniref:Pentacotripeptide-repeat region of PRORP domain-containing protein n=1 Tax=Selaginella moellendorffii TaxID=88036 RepID=D8QTD5_SELML|nr:hypothetical protein SELMODRAFT_403193 [Selaginella moellendorffii]
MAGADEFPDLLLQVESLLHILRSTAPNPSKTEALDAWSGDLTPKIVSKVIQAPKFVDDAVFFFTYAQHSGYRHSNNCFLRVLLRDPPESSCPRWSTPGSSQTRQLSRSSCTGFGDVAMACEVLVDLKSRGTAECNATLCKEARFDDAKLLFRKMVEMAAEDVTSYYLLVRPLCKAKMIEDAEMLVTESRKKLLELPLHNLVVSSYCKGKTLDAAVAVDEAAGAGLDVPGKNGLQRLPTLPLCVDNRLHEARKFPGEMANRNLTPNVVTYTVLINGLCKGGWVDEAVALLSKMRKKCVPTAVTYNSLIGRAGERGLRPPGGDRISSQSKKSDDALRVLERLVLPSRRCHVLVLDRWTL